ncbi:hypothetical protein ANANG_G00130230, partial [Anguilla anguilla]
SSYYEGTRRTRREGRLKTLVIEYSSITARNPSVPKESHSFSPSSNLPPQNPDHVAAGEDPGVGGDQRAPTGGGRGEAGQGPGLQQRPDPDKIPDFFIPPKLMCCPAEGEEPEAAPRPALRPSTSEQAIAGRKPSGSPRSPRLLSKLAGDTRSLLKAANRHIIQIESADEAAGGGGRRLRRRARHQHQRRPAGADGHVAAVRAQGPDVLRLRHAGREPAHAPQESLFHSEHTSPITSPNAQRRRGPGRATT